MGDVLVVLAIFAFYLMALFQKMGDVLAFLAIFFFYKYDIICPGRGGRQKMRDVLAVLAISAFYLMAFLQKMRDVLAVSSLLQKMPDVSAISSLFSGLDGAISPDALNGASIHWWDFSGQWGLGNGPCRGILQTPLAWDFSSPQCHERSHH